MIVIKKVWAKTVQVWDDCNKESIGKNSSNYQKVSSESNKEFSWHKTNGLSTTDDLNGDQPPPKSMYNSKEV